MSSGARNSVNGVVEHGHRRGTGIGFPTANVSFFDQEPLPFGVYAGTIKVLHGPAKGLYQGCVSIGVRPTFDGTAPNLEMHIFDFSADLYGYQVKVKILKRLRDEIKFASVGDLVAQIKKDVEKAHEFFANAEAGISPERLPTSL